MVRGICIFLTYAHHLKTPRHCSTGRVHGRPLNEVSSSAGMLQGPGTRSGADSREDVPRFDTEGEMGIWCRRFFRSRASPFWVLYHTTTYIGPDTHTIPRLSDGSDSSLGRKRARETLRSSLYMAGRLLTRMCQLSISSIHLCGSQHTCAWLGVT